MKRSKRTGVSYEYFNRQIEESVKKTGEWPEKVDFVLRKIPTEVAHAFYMAYEYQKFRRLQSRNPVGVTDVVTQLLHHFAQGNLVDFSGNMFENGIFGDVRPSRRNKRKNKESEKSTRKKAVKGFEQVGGRRPKSQSTLFGGYEPTNPKPGGEP